MPLERVPGWIERFEAAHPGTAWAVKPEELRAHSEDGSTAHVTVPFRALTDVTLDGFLQHLEQPWHVGVLLVRRGGFAVARVVGPTLAESKVGRRHVQGRSKAGGWSQQRFARRRDNQARAAFDAAAEHAGRILGPHAGALDLVAGGGDRAAVRAVLAHPQLSVLAGRPQRWLGGVADPKRDVLTQAIRDARSVRVEVVDTTR